MSFIGMSTDFNLAMLEDEPMSRTTKVSSGYDAAAAANRVPRTWIGDFLVTDHDVAQTVLRVTLAVVIFPHGAQHLLGWFGGYGFGATVDWMVSIGFPAPLAALAIIVEFVAPVALVVGFGGRVAALGIAGLMVGAASTHLEHGFFMNWFGTLPAGAEGFEYHLLALAVALAVAIRGSGAWSIDRALTERSAGR